MAAAGQLAAAAAAAAAVARHVNSRVPLPQMDEEFHVRQAQAYCAGEWATWDPLITTFPGAYWLAAGLAAALRAPCSVPALRALSTALWLAALALLLAAAPPRRRHRLHALSVATLPVTLFFAFLY